MFLTQKVAIFVNEYFYVLVSPFLYVRMQSKLMKNSVESSTDSIRSVQKELQKAMIELKESNVSRDADGTVRVEEIAPRI